MGNPNLKQVVAKTGEFGLRGSIASLAGGKLTWNLDLYHTKAADDITYE